MKAAYLARNEVAHVGAPVSQREAIRHVDAVAKTLVWYIAHV